MTYSELLTRTDILSNNPGVLARTCGVAFLAGAYKMCHQKFQSSLLLESKRQFCAIFCAFKTGSKGLLLLYGALSLSRCADIKG
uniref:Uncharacterized protein n=1 Tax=Anopheles albimanus TaxID=7167 RepID=A0A182FZE7_ANOAL